MTPEQRAVADAILSGPRGASRGLRGPFEALLHSPGLADLAQQLGAQVRFRSSLPNPLKELAIIMVARRWTAQYEWYAHRRLAVDAGLAPAIADAVAAGERPAALDGDTNAVYEFVGGLLKSGDVSDEAFSAVVYRWGKQGAMDLIGTVGYYTLVSLVLNVDRYPIPDGVTPLGHLSAPDS
jgi:4-carboxymuconolactone decarboxylase